MLTVWGKGKSSKLLAKALGCRRNKNYDIVINYKGNASSIFGRPVINTYEAIRKSSHKYRSLQFMQRAGLDVPPYALNAYELDQSQIILGRDFYHTKGADIIEYRPHAIDRNFHDYYLEYIPPKGEYRYHIAFGKLILPTKKILTDPNWCGIIRNHQNGVWKQVVCKETPRFTEACLTAVRCHGLDFGAVDFINVNGNPVMLEVNTAPGLEVQNRLDAYSNAIKEYTANVYNLRFR